MPDKFRAPLVSCYLNGLTRDEAAHQLGWTLGILKSRLEQARERLRARLAARGLALSGALLASVFCEGPASAAVPSLLLASTVQAAICVATNSAIESVVSTEVASLTEGVLNTMFLTKLKTVTAVLLMAALVAFGGGLLTQHTAAGPRIEGKIRENKINGQGNDKQVEIPDGARDMVAKDEDELLAGDAIGGDDAQVNGAEKLFRAMEKKVRDAKTLQVAADSNVESQDVKGTVKATFYATQGNKARLEIDFDIDGKADKLLFLTDGKARYTKQGDKGTLDPNPKKAEQEAKLVAGTIARIGISSAMLMARSAKPGEEKEFDLDKDAPVTNFKLGAKEMVGDKTAQVVTCKLDFDGTSARMSVWIDTKTHLPLKRVVAVDQDGKMFRITETYSTFAIDPKLDPKLFEIPKQ